MRKGSEKGKRRDGEEGKSIGEKGEGQERKARGRTRDQVRHESQKARRRDRGGGKRGEGSGQRKQTRGEKQEIYKWKWSPDLRGGREEDGPRREKKMPWPWRPKQDTTTAFPEPANRKTVTKTSARVGLVRAGKSKVCQNSQCHQLFVGISSTLKGKQRVS